MQFTQSTVSLLSCLMLLLPLLGAVIIGLNTQKVNRKLAATLPTVFISISSLIAWALFYHLHHYSYTYFNDATTAEPHYVLHITLLRWLNIADFKANWAIYLDVLSSTMLIVVTTVSALVHIYSIGYMSHDPHLPRFMSYLSLFTFCMMMLVLSDNFIQLFFGWEGVGVCSYLLISFWYHKKSASDAAMKAFLVNRVGDFGFALGIFTIFWFFETVEFAPLFNNLTDNVDIKISLFGHDAKVITIACLLLFMGAMGKSAQLGLHTWLPDAMEGPTPVSALIHAATMVTAGVFMVARCSPLFENSECALAAITTIGAITCIFAASVALVQNDIKKIIAYSTCSQLGYMFFACGVSAYAAGIFHLMTHGFFKALLFLCAGSVIHALNGEQDIRKMGGTFKILPCTHILMYIGSLALAGIFPFAGFYSKDIILEAAYGSGTMFGYLAYWLGIIAAVMTAFYSWRLLIMVFYGKSNISAKTLSHAHESPLIMLVPLFILCAGAILSGYIANDAAIVEPSLQFWHGSLLAKHESLHNAHHVAVWVKVLPLIAGLIGILLAYLLYYRKSSIPQMASTKFKCLYQALVHKWYFDELYDKYFVMTSRRLGDWLWQKIDIAVIDKVPNNAASTSTAIARLLSTMQSGFVYHYAFCMLFGLIALLTWVVYLR